MPKIISIPTQDGHLINTARYDPSDTTTGVIQIIHGFGEHHALYEPFCKFFTKNGYACVSYDQRGHGEMQELPKHKRKRGVVKNYNLFLDDVHAVRKKISQWYPHLPVYLFGHGMGRNIATNYLLKRSETEYVKAVLETPWLRLKNPKHKTQTAIARILGTISHKIVIKQTLALEDITRDEQMMAYMKNGEIYHGQIALKMFIQVSDTGKYAIIRQKTIAPNFINMCRFG
jgi:alpha-beta hydrolase superfamily lysophospholipase